MKNLLLLLFLFLAFPALGQETDTDTVRDQCALLYSKYFESFVVGIEDCAIRHPAHKDARIFGSYHRCKMEIVEAVLSVTKNAPAVCYSVRLEDKLLPTYMGVYTYIREQGRIE